jgi:WD40 repeat protein
MVACLLLASPASAAPPVTALAFQPSGKLLAAGSDRGVVFINSGTGAVTGRVDVPGPVTALAFASDGATLAIAAGLPGRRGEVRLVAVPPNEKPPRVIEAHADLIYGLAIQGNQLATGGYDKLVKLWAVDTGRELFTLKDHSDAVYAVAFSTAGRLVSCGADRAVKVWDTKTGRRLYSLTDAADWLYALAVGPDGKSVAAAGVDKSIRIWELGETDGKLTAAFFAHEGPVLRLAYSPDGATLFSLAEDRRLKAWNPATGTERWPAFALPSLPQSLAVRLDGQQFAVGRHDGGLTLHDATGKVTHQPLPEKPAVAQLNPRFAPAGRVVKLEAIGERLDSVTSVTATPNVTIKSDDRERMATKLALEVVLPGSLPPGNVPLTFHSPTGDVTAMLIVDRFDASDDARLDATMAGTCDRAGAVNTYRFELAAGQEVGAQVTLPPGSKLAPVLEWRGAGGQVCASGESSLALVAGNSGTFVLHVRDREYRGGPEFRYRLHVGRVPVVTSFEPLGLPRGATREVQLRGVHLPVRTVQVKAPADAKPGSWLDVPVKADSAVVGRPRAVVGEFYEPAANSNWISVPGTANGKIAAPGQVNTWTFEAKKGEPLVIETHARRLGSPVDSAIEVTDKDGRPVERCRLRCVAKSTLVLRDIGAADTFMRLDTWNELTGDDFMLVGGEVVRVAQLPGHPDADCDFYQVAGRRQTYFDTTPTYHSEGTPAYKVQVLPPGATTSPNGLPAVPLYFRNDDGGPGYDKDSRVIFDPPADGPYRVRVADARGNGGEAYLYRLTVRPPRPDFRLRVEPTDPRIPRGQSQVLAVTAERIDGFDGRIEVRLAGSGLPTTIEAGQTRASLIATMSKDAPGEDSPAVTGEAIIAGNPVLRLTDIKPPKAVEPGDILAFIDPDVIDVRPGRESHLQVRIERRNGFSGRVPLEVKGLPHGVRVLHIGLNGIMITEKETTRRITLYAEPWVAGTAGWVCVVAKHEEKKTDHASPPVLLRVMK